MTYMAHRPANVLPEIRSERLAEVSQPGAPCAKRDARWVHTYHPTDLPWTLSMYHVSTLNQTQREGTDA